MLCFGFASAAITTWETAASSRKCPQDAAERHARCPPAPAHVASTPLHQTEGRRGMSASWRRGNSTSCAVPTSKRTDDGRCRVYAEFGLNVEQPLPAIGTTAAAQN